MDLNNYHLRFFLTPDCNLNCIYCNDDGSHTNNSLITTNEIKGIIDAGSNLGIHKIHYTGGEPSLRKDLEEIVGFANEKGFDEQVITTNGTISKNRLYKLKDNGLSRINISLDTLDADKYKEITNKDVFHKVIDCIYESVELFDLVKINTVLLKQNYNEIEDILEFSQKIKGNIIPKFIELAQNNPVFYSKKENLDSLRVNRDSFLSSVYKLGDLEKIEVKKENPNSDYYKIKDTDMVFGLVTIDSFNYVCGNCKKIRISPFGEIGYCINFDKTSIKTNENYEQILKKVIRKRQKLDSTHPNRKHISHNYGHWRFGDLTKKYK